MGDVAVDVGEAVVAALVTESQLFVIDAKEVEAGGMEVVDVDQVLGDTEAEFVGGAVSEAAFHTTARHPDAEAFLVVIAAWGECP